MLYYGFCGSVRLENEVPVGVRPEQVQTEHTAGLNSISSVKFTSRVTRPTVDVAAAAAGLVIFHCHHRGYHHGSNNVLHITGACTVWVKLLATVPFFFNNKNYQFCNF